MISFSLVDLALARPSCIPFPSQQQKRRRPAGTVEEGKPEVRRLLLDISNGTTIPTSRITATLVRSAPARVNVD